MKEEVARELPSAHHVDKVCHDLKHLIAVGLLLSQPDEREHLDEKETRRLAMMRQQWEQAADLVSVLTEESGARFYHADLVAVCRECMATTLTSRELTLEVDDGDHVVAGDPVLLRRAVTNLVSNACRATAATGRVRIRVASEVSHSWVEVVDDGPGFGQIAGGTGLGLEIVRAAVWASAGQLRIETGPSSGTSVRMTFPAALRSLP
jgi:signal transduction histidine kinase